MKTEQTSIKKISQLFVSTLIVGFFLVGVISANKSIETLKGLEEYEQSTYGSLIYILKKEDDTEVSIEDREATNDFVYALGLDIWEGEDEKTDFAIYDEETGAYMTSDEDDATMREVINELDNDERKLTSQYDYFCTDCDTYTFLIRIEHGGILSLIESSTAGNELLAEFLIFAAMQIVVFLLFKHVGDYKIKRTIGFVFIAVWIGFISVSSAVYLNKYHNAVLEKEEEHTIYLIDHYYNNGLYLGEDENRNGREYADFIVEIFSKENGFIEDALLDNDFVLGSDDISEHISFTISQKSVENKSIEYILSTLLFMILAFILYDEASKRVLSEETKEKDSLLKKSDEKIVTIIMLLGAAIELTMTLVLPRLLQSYKIYFGASDSDRVAFIFSFGIFFNTVFAYLSSGVLKKVKSTKNYFMLCALALIVGNILFSSFNSFYLVCLGYVFISIADSLANVLMFFYINGCKDDERRDEFIIKATKQKEIGSSVGVIIGGILASIFAYGTVILFGAAIAVISLLLTIATSSKEYSPVSEMDTEVPSLKELVKKRRVLLYVLLIAVPLAFQDVFMDYKFPTDILNMGLTTVVISFVSMIKNLVAAYASPFTNAFLKKRFSSKTLTYVFGLGGALVMIANQFKTSVFIIIVSTVALGILDSFGEISYRERFEEISEKEDMSETDGVVIIKTADKLGETIGPNIITVFSTSMSLPIVTVVSFVAYMITGKKTRNNSKSQ